MQENKKRLFKEINKILSRKVLSKDELARLKIKLCKKYRVRKIPTDIEILLNTPANEIKKVKLSTFTKPGRTGSGVAVVAIMCEPRPCPHGACTMCPSMTNEGVPQSYTGKEPATLRAIRNKFDAYLQVFNRLEQYIVMGHLPQKVELIIMGGTFPAYPRDYQINFVRDAFMAMNDFARMFFKEGSFDINKFRRFFELPSDINDKKRLERLHKKILKLKKETSLKTAQKENETSQIRCVGLTIETRSDYATLPHANLMLELGCTRVELGVQSVYERALKKINRGHTTLDNIKSIAILKDLGFKLNFHMMIGLPGVKKEQDLRGLKKIFDDPRYRPDMLKIYPCMVVEHSALFQDYLKGKYKPLTSPEAAEIIARFKTYVPRYCRIMRVQRDIPTYATVAGVDRTNLRQYVAALMKKRNWKCNCIRCREPRSKFKGKDITLKNSIKLEVIRYKASKGQEFFISFTDPVKDAILGFVRMRYPAQHLRKEITPKSALIRELHVYGMAMPLGSSTSKSVQHSGLGKKLMQEAEKQAKKDNKTKIIVISGVGVREYYKKIGYKREGPYMVKYLK